MDMEPLNSPTPLRSKDMGRGAEFRRGEVFVLIPLFIRKANLWRGVAALLTGCGLKIPYPLCISKVSGEGWQWN